MQFILAFVVALLLLTAQSIWKSALAKSHFQISVHYLASRQFVEFMFQPKLLAGIALYVVATGFYFLLLQRYPLYSVQTLVVTMGIVLAFLVSNFVFGEKIGAPNVLGLAFVIVGVYLVMR